MTRDKTCCKSDPLAIAATEGSLIKSRKGSVCAERNGNDISMTMALRNPTRPKCFPGKLKSQGSMSGVLTRLASYQLLDTAARGESSTACLQELPGLMGVKNVFLSLADGMEQSSELSTTPVVRALHLCLKGPKSCNMKFDADGTRFERCVQEQKSFPESKFRNEQAVWAKN